MTITKYLIRPLLRLKCCQYPGQLAQCLLNAAIKGTRKEHLSKLPQHEVYQTGPSERKTNCLEWLDVRGINWPVNGAALSVLVLDIPIAMGTVNSKNISRWLLTLEHDSLIYTCVVIIIYANETELKSHFMYYYRNLKVLYLRIKWPLYYDPTDCRDSGVATLTNTVNKWHETIYITAAKIHMVFVCIFRGIWCSG